MNDHKDLILEGLSIRLNTYESEPILNDKKLRIKNTPRHYLKDSNKSQITNRSNYKEIKENNNSFERNSTPKENNKSIDIFSSDEVVNMRHSNVISQNNLKQRNLVNNLTRSNMRPPQENILGFNSINSVHSLNRTSTIEFTYDYDFDENGMFTFLGTLGKSTIFRNPHEIGQIKVFSSSLGKGRLSDLVGKDLVNLRTLNEPLSYFGIDLGEDRYLLPYCYSIRNRNSSSHVLLCWAFEGSNDKINFHTLDTRIFFSNDTKINQKLEKERSQLKSPTCTSTWGIDPKIKDKFPKGFRYFILRQIDKNSSGGYNLAISGLELYGTGIGRFNF
jgi:hypothetical protein